MRTFISICFSLLSVALLIMIGIGFITDTEPKSHSDFWGIVFIVLGILVLIGACNSKTGKEVERRLRIGDDEYEYSRTNKK